MKLITLAFVAILTVTLIAYVVGSETKILETAPTEPSTCMLNISDDEVNPWSTSKLKDALENLSKVNVLCGEVKVSRKGYLKAYCRNFINPKTPYPLIVQYISKTDKKPAFLRVIVYNIAQLDSDSIYEYLCTFNCKTTIFGRFAVDPEDNKIEFQIEYPLLGGNNITSAIVEGLVRHAVEQSLKLSATLLIAKLIYCGIEPTLAEELVKEMIHNMQKDESDVHIQSLVENNAMFI